MVLKQPVRIDSFCAVNREESEAAWSQANVAVSFASAVRFTLPRRLRTGVGFKRLVIHALVTSSNVPAARWEMIEVSIHASAAYGSFVVFLSDEAAFGISKMEARIMNPQMMMILETSYSTFCVHFSH